MEEKENNLFVTRTYALTLALSQREREQEEVTQSRFTL